MQRRKKLVSDLFCISFTASTAFRVISLNYASIPPRPDQVPDESGLGKSGKINMTSPKNIVIDTSIAIYIHLIQIPF